MPEPTVVPFDTLVRLGLLGRRIDSIQIEVSDLNEDLNALIFELSGVMGPDDGDEVRDAFASRFQHAVTTAAFEPTRRALAVAKEREAADA